MTTEQSPEFKAAWAAAVNSERVDFVPDSHATFLAGYTSALTARDEEVARLKAQLDAARHIGQKCADRMPITTYNRRLYAEWTEAMADQPEARA